MVGYGAPYDALEPKDITLPSNGLHTLLHGLWCGSHPPDRP